MKKTKLFAVLLCAALSYSFLACSNSSGGSSGGKKESKPETPSEGSGSGSGSGNGGGKVITPKLPTALNAGEDGTAGTNGTYVLFGEWPQSVLTGEVTVDETKSKSVGMFTYYKGSDNAWYAKISADPNDANSSDTYYKVEPVKWRVLNPTPAENEKKILLAESILINCPYYDYADIKRKIDDDDIYPNNYEHSRVRAFLNGLSYLIKESDQAAQEENPEFKNKGFLYTAFTEAERAAIADTSVVNNARSTNPDENAAMWNSGKNQYASVTPTSDKIFLLSLQEASKNMYSFDVFNNSDQTRIRKVTAFAKAKCVRAGGYWWMRSPYYSDEGNLARCVSDGGNAEKRISVQSDHIGVVPALCLN